MTCTAKCLECEGMAHHWRSDGFKKVPRFTCIHCGAKGDPCPDCEGSGMLDDPLCEVVLIGGFVDIDDDADFAELDEECPACDGWGIVEQVGANKPP